ncbi:MAG: hypothetical protein O3A25_00185 [Acidobacteria bacterium]|nr:hypothetical protein [Acidobacteriota bacterium]
MKISEHSKIDSNVEVGQIGPEFLRCFINLSSWFKTSKVDTDLWILSLELGKETPLLRVERRVSLLLDLPDVVARGGSRSMLNQLQRQLAEVKIALPGNTRVLEAVVPVVAVDEENGSGGHRWE